MKSLKTYLPSLLLSIFLTFVFLGTSILITADRLASVSSLKELSEKNKIVPMVRTQLVNHFEDKYNETGVPAEIYTDYITDDYIRSVIEININAGFERMNGGKFDNRSGIENPQLEESITTFFNDYADSIGYVRDDAYEEKLQNTIDSAYNVISDSCDIYKFDTINNEGLFAKAGGIYRNLGRLTLAAAGAAILLTVIILLINRKGITSLLYWLGSSALVSGIIGIIPCIYLNAVNYFDSFVIKQPQIFTAFTGLMYKAVDSFMTSQIVIAISGIVLIAGFAVIMKIKKKA